MWSATIVRPRFPCQATFLVDTYDTGQGVRAAIKVAQLLRLAGPVGVRLDSGDLAALARTARCMLDDAGLPGARIFASGGLDEYAIADLVAGGAPVDAYGVGTKMGVSADAPCLDSAYKLVAYACLPVMKLSPGKVSQPGAKQVYRGPGGDIPRCAANSLRRPAASRCSPRSKAISPELTADGCLYYAAMRPGEAVLSPRRLRQPPRGRLGHAPADRQRTAGRLRLDRLRHGPRRAALQAPRQEGHPPRADPA